MAPDPNAFTADCGGTLVAGRITALEGQRGLLRAALPMCPLAPGDTLVLEMHDGARFQVAVREALGPDARSGQPEFRLQLLAQERPGR